MKIRAATSADIPALLDLARHSPTGAHWSEQQYRDAINPAEGTTQRLVLIAQEQDDANLRAFLVAHHIATEWELENIVVSPHHRRKGLGKNVLNALLTKARDAHGESLFLEVRESNLAARTLYERTGFEQTGRRKAYYANPPEDAILCRLRLK